MKARGCCSYLSNIDYHEVKNIRLGHPCVNSEEDVKLSGGVVFSKE